MTPVQAAALPAILQGRDVRAKAKTGSGKTAAFGIGLLNSYRRRSGRHAGAGALSHPRAGRSGEQELRRLARVSRQNIKILTLCGGQPMGPQLDSR